MTSYADVLKNEDNVLYMGKYYFTDHKINNWFKSYNFALQATPNANVNCKHGWYQQAHSSKIVNSTTLNIKSDQGKYDLVNRSDLFSAKWWSPSVEQEGWKAAASAYLENKYNLYRDFQGEVTLASPDMSGVKANFALMWRNNDFPDKDDEKVISDTRVKVQATVQYEKDLVLSAVYDYGMNPHFGKSNEAVARAAEEAKKEKKKLEEPMAANIEMVAAYKIDDNRVWAGADLTQKFFKAGALYKHSKDLTLAKEIRYHWADKRTFMGIDQPAVVTVGAKYQASKQTELTASAEMGSTAHTLMKTSHTVDKNWKVAVGHEYNQSAKVPYQLGLDVTYTL